MDRGLRKLTRSELAKAEGYSLRIDPERCAGCPNDGARYLHEEEGAAIAVPEDSVDYAYAVSHEIAEHRCGYRGHTAGVFCEQSNILARWVRTMARKGNK